MLENRPVCCFTGHRFISAEAMVVLKEVLLLEILKQYTKNNVKDFISGGAMGFDLAAGFATLKAKKYYKDIKLHMYLPCTNQEKGWKRDDKVRYERLLGLADTTTYISKEYEDGCMHKRNRAMVDTSRYCIAYYNDRPSGTMYTLNYAKKNNLDITNLSDLLDSSVAI